jgi:hypothetical protein
MRAWRMMISSRSAGASRHWGGCGAGVRPGDAVRHWLGVTFGTALGAAISVLACMDRRGRRRVAWVGGSRIRADAWTGTAGSPGLLAWALAVPTGRADAGQGVSLSWRWESNPGTAPGSLSWAAGRVPGQLRQMAGTIPSVRATGWLNDSTYLREGATRWQAERTSASRDCRGRMVGSWPWLTSACGLGRASPGCWGLMAPQGPPSCGFGPPGCRQGLAPSGFPAGIRGSHLADARRGGTRRRRRWGARPGRRWSAGYPASSSPPVRRSAGSSGAQPW